jgi:hypothetical protein
VAGQAEAGWGKQALKLARRGRKRKAKIKREWAGLAVLLGQLGYTQEMEAWARERIKGETPG